jgi:hypothetical protein
MDTDERREYTSADLDYNQYGTDGPRLLLRVVRILPKLALALFLAVLLSVVPAEL